MTRYGTWIAYHGGSRVGLAIVLLVVAGAVEWSGSRIRQPLPLPRPRGRVVPILLVTMWVLADVAFLIGLGIYAKQVSRDYPHVTAPPTPILPITLTAMVVSAIVILVRTTGTGRERLANALIGALVAPMIFELPFDLIVMARTYPALRPHPVLYRAVFFGPLFLVEITSMALLVLAPAATVSRVAVQTFGVMLAVLAGWALVGFGFPSTPADFAFNTASKLLAFVAMLGLFFPDWFAATRTRMHRAPHPT